MNTSPGGPPAIDVREAERRLRDEANDPKPPLVVDVRELDELPSGRIDGALILPLSQFTLRFRELPADRPLLVVCQSGYRSGMAVGLLAANGYPDAWNVSGGMTAWQHAGLPTRRGALAPGEGETPAG